MCRLRTDSPGAPTAPTVTWLLPRRPPFGAALLRVATVSPRRSATSAAHSAADSAGGLPGTGSGEGPVVVQRDHLGPGDPTDTDPQVQPINQRRGALLLADGGPPEHAQRPDLMRRDRSRRGEAETIYCHAAFVNIAVVASHSYLNAKGSAWCDETRGGPEHRLRPVAGVPDRDNETLHLARADRCRDHALASGLRYPDAPANVQRIPPDGCSSWLERRR